MTGRGPSERFISDNSAVADIGLLQTPLASFLLLHSMMYTLHLTCLLVLRESIKVAAIAAKPAYKLILLFRTAAGRRPASSFR